MTRHLLLLALYAVTVCWVAPVCAQQRLSDADVRKLMMQESLAGYRGTCPCPEFRAANGSKCGARSAYSKRGAAGLLCYSEDITEQMLNDYKRRHGMR